MENDFIIDQVSWHTQRAQNYPIDVELIHRYFKSLINFLQEKGLTTRVIVSDFSTINDETCIRASDLTDNGLLLMKKAYSRWVDYAVDNKKPDDVSILEKALKKILNK